MSSVTIPSYLPPTTWSPCIVTYKEVAYITTFMIDVSVSGWLLFSSFLKHLHRLIDEVSIPNSPLSSSYLCSGVFLEECYYLIWKEFCFYSERYDCIRISLRQSILRSEHLSCFLLSDSVLLSKNSYRGRKIFDRQISIIFHTWILFKKLNFKFCTAIWHKNLLIFIF